MMELISANATTLESRLKCADGTVAALALIRHGWILQTELFGKPAAATGCKRMRLEPFLCWVGGANRS